jgi:hypothetical protein
MKKPPIKTILWCNYCREYRIEQNEAKVISSVTGGCEEKRVTFECDKCHKVSTSVRTFEIDFGKEWKME